jgi:hypothetical protein
MKYVLLTMVVVSSFVVGSENEGEIISFKVSLDISRNDQLFYRDSKYISDFKKNCGVECLDNEGFVQILIHHWYLKNNAIYEIN